LKAEPVYSIFATTTGLLAQEILESEIAAVVIGSTSRGLFLLTPSNRVLFLSYESWRSPLTINLDHQHALLKKISTGAKAQITPAAIDVPAAGIMIDLAHSTRWQVPSVPHSDTSAEQQQQRLHETGAALVKQSSAGFAPLLADFIGLADRPALDPSDQAILVRINQLHQSLYVSNIDLAAEQACSLLGYGRGLTPSGDDLIAGLLLAINRWPHLLPDDRQRSTLNDRLVEHAYTHTTALSANIIAAAGRGEADERLIGALDALFTSQLQTSEAARLLLSYGSSSGIDAFLGMALILIKKIPPSKSD
jgi:hypothetical protein